MKTESDGAEPLDPAALALLFERHAGGLGGAIRGLLGRRADVSEVLQEAYVRALRALQAGEAPHEPVGWIFVLTLNLCRDLRRKEWRRGPMTALDDVDEALMESQSASPRQALEAEEERDAAREAIHELDDEIKSVFLLRVSGELPFQEVASALEIPLGTAKTRMRRALRELREKLKAYDPLDQPMGPRTASDGGTVR